MRTYLQDYEIVKVASLTQALDRMKQSPITPIAGGTDLMVLLNFGKLKQGTYLDLHSIPELKGEIRICDEQVHFSSLTTYMDVLFHPFFKEKMCLLREAASVVGAPGIQVRGTWAGNIVNASPAADGVPALMVYDAHVVLASAQGTRNVALSNFYHGYKKMARREDELITEIVMNIPEREGVEYYRKVGERKAQAISKVLLAGRLEINSEKGTIANARVVYGSVMPYTYRSYRLEEMLIGQKLTNALIGKCVAQIGHELKPIDDIRSTAEYRRKVAQNLLEEFLTKGMEKAVAK